MFSKTFKNKLEALLVLVLLLVTTFLRFSDLSYSHLYGDETKTINRDKTVTLNEFLLNQRKGPVQFLTVHYVKEITGDYDEGDIRFPFAVASTLSVVVLYLFLKRRYSYTQAFFGSFLYSIGGFFVAFGRTAQYQSFLFLFGLLSVFFADLSIKGKKHYLSFSGVFLALAFLSHYDAVFFAVPVLVILVRGHLKDLKQLVLFFVPLILLTGIFYVPYYLYGYFEEYTRGYLKRRLTIDKLSSSFHTFVVYHPNLTWLVFLPVSIYGWFVSDKKDKILYLLWFLIPFLTFELIFSSSGTHIQNYILPLIILFAAGLNKTILRWLIIAPITVVFVVTTQTFVPRFSSGYPWKHIANIKKDYQLFLYGFPYNRGWDQIASYLNIQGIESFYTTDNVTIGEYYLNGKPANVSNPEYFIHVFDNQEFKVFDKDVWLDGVDQSEVPQTIKYQKVVGKRDARKYYELEVEICVEENLSALIYKKSQETVR